MIWKAAHEIVNSPSDGIAIPKLISLPAETTFHSFLNIFLILLLHTCTLPLAAYSSPSNGDYFSGKNESPLQVSNMLSVLCPDIDRNGDGLPDGLAFSTGPFQCTASIKPPPPEVESDCWNWNWTFELWAERPDPLTGEIAYRLIAKAEDQVVEGIPPGLYDIHYIVEDVCGAVQRQECTLQVIDESGRICKAQDVRVGCTELTFDPLDKEALARRFGSPGEVLQLDASCSALIEEELTWTPSDCETGTIRRHFTVTTPAGYTSNCVQTIYIEPQLHYRLRFPVDDEIRDCRITEADTPQTEVFGCDLLALSQDTIKMETDTKGACYELLIKHQVINWCEYDGSPDPTPIVLRTEPELDKRRHTSLRLEVNYDDPSGEVLRIYEEDGNAVKVLETYSMAAYQKWTRGLFEYTQVLEVYDDTPPQVDYGNTPNSFCAYGSPDGEGNCGTKVSFSFTAFDNCSPEAVTLSAPRLLLNGDPALAVTPVSGAFTVEPLGALFLISGELPLGSHRFVWTLTDACGNVADRNFDFTVEDCRAPLPICRENLVIPLSAADLDGDGIVESAANTVWASDLVEGTTADCSAPLEYSINRAGAPARREQNNLIFTCDDPVAQPIPVEVHAWDAAGNHDYCEVIIVLQDDRYLCSPADGGVAIAGAVTTEKGNPVAGIELQLSGARSKTTRSDSDGRYRFDGLLSDYDYSVRPWLDEDILNGVSTYDLVLISQHILGRTPLRSPYQLIAADLNNSGTITTLDLVELRRLILSVENEFRNNASWRFIDASYVFPKPEDPWFESFPEVININDLKKDRTELDFIAVKVGDVSGNVRPAGNLGTVEMRGSGASDALYVYDEFLLPGRLYEVPLYLSKKSEVAGCQFTLQWSDHFVEWVGAASGRVDAESTAVFPEAGKMTVSWIGEAATGLKAQESSPLLTLQLRVREGTSLSDVLKIAAHPTPSESYGPDGRERNLELEFSDLQATGALVLDQNYPNPFRTRTVIGFKTVEAGPVHLIVNDAGGRVVYKRTAFFQAGRQAWSLDRQDLPGEGLFFYTLKSAGKRETLPMVVLPAE